MKVSQLMTQPVWTCSPNDTLDVAARIMWENDVGSVVVVENDAIVGILTDRDVCMGAFTTGNPLWSLPVRNSMASPPARVDMDATIDVAGRIMRSHRVRRLPVVDAAGALVGLLSLDDIAIEAEREHGRSRPEIADRAVVEMLAAVSAPRRPQELAQA